MRHLGPITRGGAGIVQYTSRLIRLITRMLVSDRITLLVGTPSRKLQGKTRNWDFVGRAAVASALCTLHNIERKYGRRH
jgi:hypothetical protein